MVVDGFPTKLEKKLPPSTIVWLCKKCSIGFTPASDKRLPDKYCRHCYKENVKLAQYDVSKPNGKLPF